MNAHLRQSLGQQNKMRAYRRAAPPSNRCADSLCRARGARRHAKAANDE